MAHRNAQVEDVCLTADDRTEGVAAAQGLNTDFERIAEVTGVGSGTLYRNFPVTPQGRATRGTHKRDRRRAARAG